MKKLYEITYIELKLYLRTFVNVFFALVFPSLLLLIMGGIYGNEPSEMFDGYGTVDVSVPSYTALIIAVNGIMSLPLAVVGYREKKILKRLKATPIHPVYILLSQILINLFMTFVGMVILFVVGKLVFDLHFMGNAFDMFVAFLLSTLSIFSIGLLIASFAPTMKFATAVANIVYFPMLFLTGATLPLEIMPNVMLNISKALPLTYAVDLLKGIWLGKGFSDVAKDIWVLVGILLVSTLISIKNFKWE
ncbi:MAG: ABC-type multidrug transport system, permease component [Candidatus Carbobacillus altaicus]|uniref:Transport permease protein n=1 Tax=Candidatus Carbonibacillus altaicus TaxID=2163959 RepID=A0A2R6Y0Y1_9BACL|nr:MAG: ABC-type multidrug transport system, permease component [Candidatus Carbobacillus altaicus]